MLVSDLLDMIEENKRRYEKRKAFTIIVGFLNTLITINMIIRGRWLFSCIGVISIVCATITFLRYRKSHQRFLEYFSGISGKKVV